MIVNIMSAPSASVRLRSKSKTDFSSVFFSPTLCPRGNDRGRLFEAALTTNIQRSTGTDTSGLVRNVVQAGSVSSSIKMRGLFVVSPESVIHVYTARGAFACCASHC